MRRLLFIALLLATGAAWSDAIMRSQAMFATTIAEIYIEDEFVRLELAIGLENLTAFKNLLPDELYQQMNFGDLPFPDRLQNFLGKEFVVIADGESLAGRLTRIGPSEKVRRDEITGEPLPVSGEPEMVVTAEFVWPLKTRPDNVDLQFRTPGTSVGFVVYHKGVAVNDFRYLSHSQRLNLDWDDPWYSSFSTRSLRRQYYSPMAGFIYVEPYEVRKEIIVRPKDLQRWVDLGLEDLDTIPAAMQADILQKATAFLAEHHPVTIDGESAKPSLMRANFLERTLRTSRVIDPPVDLDINAAIIGVISVYPHKAFADNVTMEWDMFDDRIQIVPVAGVDPTGPLPQLLEPGYSTLEWQNFIRIPVMPELVSISAPPGLISGWMVYLRWLFAGIALMLLARWVRSMARNLENKTSAGLAAALAIIISAGGWWMGEQGRLNTEATETVVTGLLTNVYRSFDFRDENDIYDVLARSVDGDLLRDVYLEMRRGLVLASQGGASAKVKEVELINLVAEPAKNQGVTAEATWQVRASVGHWGHIHERRNEYRATLRLQPLDGAWKLIDVEILDEVRL
jgi:hypothetical protein